MEQILNLITPMNCSHTYVTLQKSKPSLATDIVAMQLHNNVFCEDMSFVLSKVFMQRLA